MSANNNYYSNKPVSYVLAVSGGVDSVALLDILARQAWEARSGGASAAGNRPGFRLTVAHYDHGIREDSALDRHFVQQLAAYYGLPFTYDEGRLGAGASEAQARKARYAFLRRVKEAGGAHYIVTAHHEDDLFETAIINLLRGTGRKGLSSLRTTEELYRPLLHTPKAHLITYARKQGLNWREDSTNQSDAYLRNYIRRTIMPRFDEAARQRMRQLLHQAQQTNIEIDSLLAEQLHLQPNGDALDRQWFIMLPHKVALEIVAAWLRHLGIADFDHPLLERIVVAAKTYAAGKRLDVNKRFVIAVTNDQVVMLPRSE
jgi:tRNA(Ile)-lysidine synthetase-like protein